MKKFRGNTLVEVLTALCVLGIALPASLDALGTVLTANLKISEKTYMASASEWWFNRLGTGPRLSEINAAPKSDGQGRVNFEWETKRLSNGAVLVTLRVYGQMPGAEYTARRIF